uniref:Large ribosomal subunit protein uL22c n=1 Tax=Netrium digitus TaxID=43946 RepID=A0A191T563_9VIRI|nr:ribosomal protein L22 [Netrium digitus]ANI25522.1 ribosomal protein L22 [Netrium digitus]
MTEISTSKMEARAFAKGIRMSPYKIRKVINQIRGLSYEEAVNLLGLMPYRACSPVFQVVHSAVANANHNLNLSKASLYISEAKVDKGPVLKRFRPRAQGRGYPIRKPSSSITIIVKPMVNDL